MKLKDIMMKIPIIIRDFLLKEIKDEIKEIRKDNKNIHEEIKQNRLETQKIAICSEELPLAERVTIGRDYIKNGGNGAVKIKVHVLEEEYEQQLKEECKNV